MTMSVKQSPTLATFKRLGRFARDYATVFMLALVVLFVATALEMLAPWLMKIILDEHIAPGVNDTMTLAWLGAALFAVYLGSAALQYLQSVMFQHAALKVVHDIRLSVISHVLKLPMRFFDSESTGRLISRITNDSEVLRQMFVGVLPAILQAFLRVVGIFIAMALLNLQLMLVTALLVPLILLAIHWYHKVSNPIMHGVRTQLANINSRLNESLGGMRIIQAMGQQAHQQVQFDRDNQSWSEQKRQTVNIDSLLLMPLTNLLNAVALAVVVAWFGYQSGFTTVEIGTLYAFINYLGRFFEPFKQLTMQMSHLQQSMVASERVFALLDQEVEHKESDTGSGVIKSGKLEFERVSLSYDGEHQALDDVSFTVEPGQFVAIVGHSGSGKSSIINLLMGFYRQQSGQIRIDGQSHASLSAAELHRGIGLVFQEPYIFSGTMADNIRLDTSLISDEQMRSAAMQVHADDFIKSLAGGYHHQPGAGGKALSAGERQLLSFARTVAHNPKILLLDEATANIDGETEHKIKLALITLRQHRTTIAVAHRLATIRDADLILVMDKGKIVQRGRHDELLAVAGHYRDLYLAQQTEEQLSMSS